MVENWRRAARRIFIAHMSVLGLSGCAFSSGVKLIYGDLYTVEGYGGSGLDSQKVAISTAREYCAKYGTYFKMESILPRCAELNGRRSPCEIAMESEASYVTESGEETYKQYIDFQNSDMRVGTTLNFHCVRGDYRTATYQPRSQGTTNFSSTSLLCTMKNGTQYNWSGTNCPTNLEQEARDTHASVSDPISATSAAHRPQTNAPPVVSINPIPPTSSQVVDVVGSVTSKGRMTALTIEGVELPLRKDGTFSVRRGIPLGDSVIKVSATDEWGQTSESLVKVTRVTATPVIAMAPLDPNRLRGKAHPMAVALIIGIANYETAPLAEFADNDARSFYDYAVNALGVPADRIRLLTNSEARQHDIVKALLSWAKPLIVRGRTDVYVYFSGHGLASADGNDLFLLPYDGDRDLLERSAVRRKELIDTVVDAGAASATFFLDTCYSGGTRGGDSLVISARPILLAAKDQQVPSNVTIFAAAGSEQLSSSMAQTKHGLFSYFLMKGLEGDAAGADHRITAATLEAYLADRIPPEAAKLGRNQTPQLVGDGNRVLLSW